MTFKELSNSGLLWTLVIIGIILVAVITMYYYFNCRHGKRGRKVFPDFLHRAVPGNLYRPGFSGGSYRPALRLVQTFRPRIRYI